MQARFVTHVLTCGAVAGIGRLPQSLPNMLSAGYSQANLRHSLAMQLGSGSIAHSMSLRDLHHGMLLQRERGCHQGTLSAMDAHWAANSPFFMMQKEQQQQQQLANADGLHSDDAVMGDGLDGAMMEMLLPEEA